MAIDVKNYRSSRGAAVNIVSTEELHMVLEFFEKKGFRWSNGRLPTSAEEVIRYSYDEFGDGLGISFYDADDESQFLSYCDIGYYRYREYDIFSTEELLGSETPKMEDITTLF